MRSNLEQFRIFDLVFFTVLATISEIMGEVLQLQFTGAGFYLSFSVLVAFIAIVRWDEYGVIVLIVAGLPMIILGPNIILHNIIMYPLANCFIIFTALVIKRMDKEDLLEDPLKLLGVIVLAYLSVTLGKAFGLLLIGEAFIKGGGIYFITQLFNILMTYIVVLLLRKREGLIVDMKKLFERANLEEKL